MNTFFQNMFSIGENWISFLKINESENNFMEKLYHHGILIWYYKIQGSNENILIFWPYVYFFSLVMWSNMKPK